MQIALRLNLYKSTALSGSSIDFLTEELTFWLNEAQLRFIKQRLFGTNYKTSGFEQSAKRFDDLNNLVTKSSLISLSQSTYADNVLSAPISTVINDSNNPYLYFVTASLEDQSGRNFEVGSLIDHASAQKLYADVLNQPYIRRPLVSINKNTTSSSSTDMEVLVIYDNNQLFVPTGITIQYIRRPRTLSLTGSGTYETSTCELPLSTHNEIVSIAASLLLENIESQRVQTFEQLNASKIE